jgi:hypothetical protein
MMNGHTNGSSGASSPIRLYDARSLAFPGPTPQSEDYDTFRGKDTAIVIDNGILAILALLLIHTRL